MTKFHNNFHDDGQIPGDLPDSMFIELPKKAGGIKCKLHWAISLMSHLTKILLRIMID